MSAKPAALVSGSFDDLRLAEVRLLEEAARYGPVHVLLRPDETIQTATGAPPKFPLAERQYLIQSLRYVAEVSVLDAAAGEGIGDWGLGTGGTVPIFAGTMRSMVAKMGLSPSRGATWVVREAEDSADKRQHYRRMGWQYQTVPEAVLQRVPPDAEGVPEASPPLAAGRKRVLVTGCFDWFHSGHVRFFEEVAALGELYVVLGHDANIRLLKGEGHPLFPQAVRRYMVAAVRWVRQALVATGDGWLDAEPEIRRLRPQIYAVNADGDRPEKRAYCEAHGIEYRVLERAPKPGLPPRKSTDLRGF
jgi:cytidyltransferase-like protein